MIFDIVTSGIQECNDKNVYLREVVWETSWELLEMLYAAFPNTQFRLVCFSGYDNAVAIPRA